MEPIKKEQSVEEVEAVELKQDEPKEVLIDEVAEAAAKDMAALPEKEQEELEQAQKIIDASDGLSEKEQALALTKATALAIYKESFAVYNTANKISKAFVQNKEKMHKNFMVKKLEDASGKRRKTLANAAEIEFKVLWNNHMEMQEALSLKTMTELYFSGPVITKKEELYKESKHAIKYLCDRTSPNASEYLKALRYCVKEPMESLYAHFAIALQRYAKKRGTFDSRTFLRSIVHNLKQLAVAAAASSLVPEEDFKKVDMTYLEEFSNSVENFDKKLAEVYLTNKKD